MKKLPLAKTLLLAIGMSAPAAAADMAVKAPVAPPPPVFSWTGFYIGGDLGGGWARSTATETDMFSFALAGGPNTFNPTTMGLNGSGFIGGGFVGYNYQFAPNWVAGIEANYDYANIKANNGAGVPLAGNAAVGIFPPTPIVGTAVTAQASYQDLWSIRGRLGYAQPSFMIYATGGYAQMTVNLSGNVFFAAGAGGAPTTENSPGSLSATRSGWAAGAGIEFKPFPGPWIVGVEYLHYGFDGTNSVTAAFVPVTIAGNCAPGQQCFKYSIGNVDLDAVRVRLSYKFGGPIVAKY